jgi:hypothetical protein
MDWKHFAPYLAPLLAVAFMARRVLRAQQPKAVKTGRLWILPAILLVLVGLTLANGRMPPPIALAAFAAVAAVGAAIGWYRVHTLEFSVDPESGAIMSKATPFGAFLLVGLIVVREALNYVLKGEGVRGAQLVLWTDGALIFAAAMLVAQSAHTWVRARRLAPAPKA